MRSDNHTRCVRAVMLSAVTAAFLLAFSFNAARSGEPFPDVPKDHWAFGAVQDLQQRRVLIGFPNGTFNGILPKVVHVPKPVYDLSTPQDAFWSLIRAMGNCDEAGLEVIYPRFLAQRREFRPDQTARFKDYRRIAKRWKYLRIGPDILNPTNDKNEIYADMVDTTYPIGQADLPWHAMMKRIGGSWQIESLSREW